MQPTEAYRLLVSANTTSNIPPEQNSSVKNCIALSPVQLSVKQSHNNKFQFQQQLKTQFLSLQALMTACLSSSHGPSQVHVPFPWNGSTCAQSQQSCQVEPSTHLYLVKLAVKITRLRIATVIALTSYCSQITETLSASKYQQYDGNQRSWF
jgi:hypothetical protein